MQDKTVKKVRTLRLNTRDLVFVLLMLAFPLAQFAVFYLGTNVGSWIMAFQIPQFGGKVKWTFLNFDMFFTDLFSPITETRFMLWNTLRVFLVADFVILPIATLFSYFLYSRIFGASFFRVVFFLPSIISAVAMTMIFRYTIEVGGPLNKLADLFGIRYPLLLGDKKYAFSTILFYNVWSGLGYSIVLLSGAISRIPKELQESAQIDGARYMRVFVSLVVPLVWPTVSMLFVLNIATMFGYMGPVLLLTNGANQTSTIAFFIYKGVKVSGSYNYSAAVGLLMTLVGAPLVFGVKALLGKAATEAEF